MKVLFAHSFFMAFDDKQRVVREPYPPLGTLIAAACARREGHQVALFDAMPAEDTADFGNMLAEDDFDGVVFFEDNFNWLSKMCLQRMRAACGKMIAMARVRELLVLVAGSDPSDEPGYYLEKGADYVIRGEAEFGILEILAHHGQGGTTACEGPGIFRIEGGKLTGLPSVRGKRDLSVFPSPARDLVDMDTYRRLWQENHGYFSLNMMTTRGCPYRCNWCAKPIHGRRYDVRDPKDCAREMYQLGRDYAPDHIWFTDDIFGLKPKWVELFAEEVENLGTGIPFKIQARADLMTPTTVAALKRAGCRTVWLGVESGSQKVLDAMDKDLEVETVYRASRLLQQAEIEVCFFLQFGYPGEKSEDIYQTWQMITQLRPDHIGISVAYPLPGTPFHERVKDQLWERDHWAQSSDMMPMHRTAYPPEFYPLLYQYIHQLFRKLKSPRSGLRGLKDRLIHRRTRGRLESFGVEGIPFP